MIPTIIGFWVTFPRYFRRNAVFIDGRFPNHIQLHSVRESEESMRHSQWVGLVCLTACLMLASTAMAQGQGGGGRGGRGGLGGRGFNMGAAQLLRNEKVQEELKLTGEQKDKLAALREEGGGRGIGRGGQDLSPEEREKAMAEFQKRMEEINKKAEAVLDAAQVKRLKEISLQARGNAALNDEEVAKALMLTEEQVAGVKTITEESTRRMREMFRSAGQGGDREELQKKMAELRKDTDEEYLALLTDEQKSKLEAMKGAKFEIDFSTLRGGGGRRRGGNNN
jgi:Spy/CpxP family protein refolding chaperone